MEGYNKVVLPVPFRIHSFVTEFGRMYEEKSKHSFGGGFGFSVSTGNYLIVQRSEKRVVKAPYKNVIGKYIDLFKEIYEYDGEFIIELKEEFPKHSGFGSTIVMITTTCAALNILLGNKLFKTDFNGNEYIDARNFASNVIQTNNSSLNQKYSINFLAFTSYTEADVFETKEDQMDQLRDLGFAVCEYEPMKSDFSKESISAYIKKLKDKADNMSIPVDGIVITFNNVEFSKSLGRTSHHYNDSLAYKF